ncbi:hypothetical protein [Phaeobacter sp. J2-8]|uniref:hypothetical protein n=1 Tax=Phaeobacter sp. J2-8 TaxID=2931394 RepID=UPI001FD268CB|nr:hypothetical protein [Phaeobacter sp. J2-8]MCJ7874552.1 hypothetical protein [Phaeobacter sp. J2-8]
MPSRAAFATGQYPHQTGYYCNATPRKYCLRQRPSERVSAPLCPCIPPRNVFCHHPPE